MDIEEIKQVLPELDISQLRQLKSTIAELIKKTQDENGLFGQEGIENMRGELRFDTEIHASVRRITDVSPNERTEYAGIICDISRTGLRIRMMANFMPSRIVEATFQAPTGQTKTSLLEVVRMKKVVQDHQNVIELGCRTVARDIVDQIRVQEEKILTIEKRLQEKNAISIFVVSADSAAAGAVAQRLQTQGYRTATAPKVQNVIDTISPTDTPLVIVLNSSQLFLDNDELKALAHAPAQLARMIVIEDEADRPTLMQLGVDEYVPAARLDELLLHTVDRALLGHATRQTTQIDSQTDRILVISTSRSKANMIGYHLDENKLPWKFAGCAKEMSQEELDHFEVIIMDFDPDQPEHFTELCKRSENTPVVALCDHIAHGSHAMACMAADYLCLPLHESQVTIMLQSLVPALAGAE